MSAAEKAIIAELDKFLDGQETLLGLLKDADKSVEFGTAYQSWYSKALSIVTTLAPDRLAEFKSYYERDPKRKSYSIQTYTIQDYVMGMGATRGTYSQTPSWDAPAVATMRVLNQLQILASLRSRVGSVLSDVRGSLFVELQDGELEAATRLLAASVRAAGALGGVVLERHLRGVAANHNVVIRKRKPTIADLNDQLKAAGAYQTPVWRKIQYLGDIRNLCTHSKGSEPTKEQVKEMLQGVAYVVKNVS